MGTRKCGTYSSFTHPFFSRTKHCKIRSGTGTWFKFLTSRHTRNPSAHAALFTKYGAILSGTSAHSLGRYVQTKGAEGSSENVGSAQAVVYTGTFYPSQVLFSGTSTNFTRARTTFSVGPSSGKSLVRHG